MVIIRLESFHRTLYEDASTSFCYFHHGGKVFQPEAVPFRGKQLKMKTRFVMYKNCVVLEGKKMKMMRIALREKKNNFHGNNKNKLWM